MQMNKKQSFFFATTSMICLIAAGASLSYFKPWWALLFLILSFAITGAGMAYKRRIERISK
jgi:hypothetical protein